MTTNAKSFEDDNRGNHAKQWQFPLRDDKFRTLLRDLAPSVPFTATDVYDMMNPPDSLEDIIKRKYLGNKKKKMSNADSIRLKNIERKKDDAIKYDMELIKNNGFRVQTKTPEGKELQLLMILQYAVEKNNTELIANCYIKMLDRVISDENKIKFRKIIQLKNSTVDSLDIIKLQFTTFSNQLPPLDRTEFILDDWQKEVITMIDNKDSIVVMCPTSSGKTVVSTYVTSCGGKILFVVPTEALAMQVAAHFCKALDTLVGIETDNTHAIVDPEKNKELLKNTSVIVGTPLAIEKVVTELGCVFDYVVYDEIHNLDGEQGEAIERITKMLNQTPFLALSATIGNLEDLTQWWQTFTEKPIRTVTYTGRFFNLQKCIYNQDQNEVNRLNPLSMITIQDFLDGSILDKNLQMTPSDIYDLVEKSMNVIDLEDLHPDTYFDKSTRVHLNHCNEYFRLLLERLQQLSIESDEGKEAIVNILANFNQETSYNENINIMDFVLNLRDSDLTPAICFQLNNISCYKIALDLVDKLEKAEDAKYPNRAKELEKQMKVWKKWNEKNEKETSDMSEKQLTKQLASGTDSTSVEKPVIDSPHKDFIVTKNVTLTETAMKEYKRVLRFSFKGYGDDMHPILRALYRGIGVYVEGMPNSYLRIVQQLAQQKKLGVVFSDSQLAFGVSMPFKTSSLIKNPYGVDTMDPLVNLQASGRAGRRGLDTEGFVIYAGYTWNEVIDLSISPLPRILGRDFCYPMIHLHKIICDHIHGDEDNDKKPTTPYIITHPLNNTLAEQVSTYYDWSLNKLTNADSWTWCADTKKTDKSMLFNLMVWDLGRKYPTNSICIPYIIKFIERKFANVNHTLYKEQVRMAKVLAHFISQEEATDSNSILEMDPDCLIQLNKLIEKDVPISNNNIDYKVWKSIERNGIVETENDFEKYQLSQRIWHFGENIRILQNYCFYAKRPLVKLLGKLFTRIWWIYANCTTSTIV